MATRKGTRITSAKFVTFHDPEPLWKCRVSEGPLRQPQGGTGPAFRTVTAELVWGQAVSRNGLRQIEGKAYHSMTGALAEASITELAQKLNAKKYPPQEMVRTKADGAILPRDGGPNQMTLGEVPREQIQLI